MLSTLFPPDPTLTVDNVSRVMKKVKPTVKMQVCNDVLQDIIFRGLMFISGEEFSFKEEECADVYVNCCHFASWERLAGSLYRHHQVAAVEEVRSYLPPRGEPHFGILLLFSVCYSDSFMVDRIAKYNVHTHKLHYSG